MANRILLNTEGLKVSAPGFNVLTDSGANILFDSDFGTASVAYRGSFVVQSNDWGTNFSIPISFPAGRFPYVFIHGYDASRGYSFTAGGFSEAGIWHNSLGTVEQWYFGYVDNGSFGMQCVFMQGSDMWDGPQGSPPPRAGPQAFPYTLNYVLLDIMPS